MATRKPTMPCTVGALVKLIERDDLTPAEQHRALIGALACIALKIGNLAELLEETNATASKVLDVVLKQHAALLLDRTDPPEEG